MNKELKINLGCGTDIKKGWVNVDIAKLEGVDIVHNLNDLPLPFVDLSVAEIRCMDVLEHIQYIPFLKDCLRILVPAGRMYISVPHFTACNNYDDPTHINRFSIKTLNYFCRNTYEGSFRGYYFDFSFSQLVNPVIVFETGFPFYHNHLIQWFVNLSDRTRRYYDATGFSRIFPALGIRVTLVK